MKQTIKLLFLLLLLISVCAEVTLLSGCKQCDVEEEMVMNPLVGTKWSAPNGEYLFFKTETKGTFFEGDDYDKGELYEDFSYAFDNEDNTIFLAFGGLVIEGQYSTSYIIIENRKFYKE